MSEDNKDDKYKGPGKFVAGLGRGVGESVVGQVGGIVAGAAVGAALKNTMRGASIGSMIGAGAGLVHGVYAGVSSVTEAKEQLASKVKEIDDLKTENKFQKMVAEKDAKSTEKGGRV